MLHHVTTKEKQLVRMNTFRFKKLLFTLAVIVTVHYTVTSQCDNPPNGESCLCSTAPILCTPDELEGFTFSMSDAVNDGDLPTGGFFTDPDLCPGIEDQGGFPNNVNFFAFIAWCEDLTIDVLLSNCQDNPNDGMQSFGVQIALFAGCGSGNSGWDPVECFTEGDDACYDTAAEVPAVQTFATTGLTIGNTYYFMLDGCARSTCDITLDVVGVCGTGTIDPWTTGIEGPTEVCTGLEYTYTTEDLDGAVEFYYYLDGVLIEDGTELQSIDQTFNTAGTYELCVDVSNLPCIPETDGPGQDCITINVSDIDAGDITVNPTPLCPGETTTITVTNYATGANIGLVLYIVNEDGIIEEVVMGDNTTATYDQCVTWTAYSYSYLLSDMPVIQTVGEVYQDIDCSDTCCDVEEEDIVWEDTEAPVLSEKPTDITVICEDLIPDDPMVTATDNCFPTLEVTIDEQVDYTLCDGGTLVRSWVATDSCGNTDDHSQTITIDGIPIATFDSSPANETVACIDEPSSFADLVLSNGASGSCEINEIISPTVEDNTTECGGNIVVTWSYTDLCDRPYEYIQTITIDPPAEPTFATTPTDITLTCGEAIPPAEDILVSNSSAGSCLLEELISPTVEDNTTDCDGTLTYTWTYSDDCGNDLEQSQTITILPPTEPAFTEEPENMTLMCTEIPTTIPVLMYDNGLTGTCQISGSIEAEVQDMTDACGGTITYSWSFTDICDRTITYEQTLTIEPAPEGAFVDVPESITVQCGDVGGDPIDLVFTNGSTGVCEITETISPTTEGVADVCGSTVTYTWTYTDLCDRVQTETQTVTFEPADDPMWIDLPADVTVDCADFEIDPPTLSYGNNLADPCEIAGTVEGMLIGEPGPCGEPVSILWETTDECGNPLSYTQNITINEASEPAFENLPPATTTVACEDASTPPGPLTYTNGETGFCERAGSVAAVQSGSFDECGGTLVYTWTTTDECGFALSFSQTVTVTPAADPVFLDLPEDITLDCGEELPDPVDLTYSNSAAGACLVTGTVSPTSTTTGLTTTYTWTHTTECTPSTTLMHMQSVTETPSPEIEITPTSGTICEGDFYDLSTITVNDLNGGTITVEYLDAAGAVTTNPFVSPFVSTFFIIRITNEFGCTDEATFDLQVDTPVNAGTGTSGTACAGQGFTSLFDYIDGPFDPGGSWFDIDGSGANINFPQAVDFTGILPGIYQFDYTVFSGNSCPDQTASIFIEIVEDIDFDVAQLVCDPGGQTYTLTVNTNGNQIFSSFGDVTVIDENTAEVTGVPVVSLLVLTAFDGDTGCLTEVFVNPPDCDCPDVPAPVAPPITRICVGEQMPALAVTVGAGMSANWYDTASGGNLLQAMSLTYTPTVSAEGIYTYYVEAVDAEDCISFTRTPVRLEIVAPPVLMTATFEGCPTPDGSWDVALANLNNLLNTNAALVYVYYNTLADAENEANPITSDTLTLSAATTLYAVVTNAQGCSSIGTVSLTILEPPTYTLTIEGEVCAGDDNGVLTISNISPVGTLVDIDGTDYTDTLVYVDLAPGTYTLASITPDGCTDTEEITIGEGVLLTATELMIACDDSGTETEPADDFYIISLTLLGIDPVTAVVTDAAGVPVTVTATSPLTFTYPATETAETFTITDPQTGCDVEVTTASLNPCSTNCSFESTVGTPICDDNGTPTDATDDFYTVTVNATSVNGTAVVFNVLLGGSTIGTFPYGVGGTVEIPASTADVQITIIDADDPQCFENVAIGALPPCSNDCTFDVVLVSSDCNDNGTLGVESDDFYTVTLTVNAENTASDMLQITTAAGADFGTYMYGETIELTIPAQAEELVLLLADSVDGVCNGSLSLDVNPCSGSCTIMVEATDPVCANVATADDATDDTYTAQVTVNITAGSGSWTIAETGQTGTSGETITVGPYLISDGDVTLTIADTDISTCLATITLVAPAPCSNCDGSAEAGDDQELSCGTTEVTLTGSSMPMAPNAYWTTPAGLDVAGTTINAASTGTYVFTADYGEGCLRTDSLTITTDNSVPIADVGPDLIFDCDTDSLIIQSTVVNGSGPYTYQWTDADGTVLGTADSLVVFAPGQYTLVVIDQSTLCESPEEVINVIDEIAGPAAVIYADPTNILDCVIEVILLSSDEEPGTVYEWSIDGQPVTTEQLSISEPADILLVAIDILTGCQNTDQLSISSLVEYPIIDVAPYGNLDCDVTELVLDASTSQSGPSIVYTWTDEQNNTLATDVPTLTVTAPGIYYLELVDTENGCSNSDTLTVLDVGEYPDITLPTEGTIACDETAADVTVVVNTMEPNLAFAWQAMGGTITQGADSPTAIVDGPGIYTVTVTNLDNGCPIEATIELRYPDQISDLSLFIEDESCEENMDGAAQVIINAGGTPPYQYILNNEPIGESAATELSAGTYSLSVVDANSCVFDTSFVVGVLPPFEASLPATLLINEGQPQTITIATDLPEEQIGSIVWSPSSGLDCDSCLTVTYDAVLSQTYTVTITDIFDCAQVLTLTIDLSPTVRVTFPSVFNPSSGANGNGLFYPIVSEEDAIVSKLDIYDRWGNKVFSNTNFTVNTPADGWDGTYKSQAVAQGVFVYYCEITFADGRNEVFSGDVTILR